MPYDDDGNIADIVTASDTVISRMNIGIPYEGVYNFASRKAKELIIKDVMSELGLKDSTKLEDHLSTLSPDSVNRIYDDNVNALFKILDTPFYEYSKVATLEEKIGVLREAIIDELFIDPRIDKIKPNGQPVKKGYIIAEELKASKFGVNKRPINIRDEDGNWTRTEEPATILPMYIILLSKIADSWLATSSAKVNHHGIPVRPKAEKHRLPYNNSPVKTQSETEARLFTYGSRNGVFLSELVYRTNSPRDHKLIYRNIIRADKPTNIDDAVPRDKYPYEGNNVMDIIDSHLNVAGAEFQYVEDGLKDDK